ncbi:MAG: FGGY-family carbohydrate kinase [Chloroflexota bacterium]
MPDQIRAVIGLDIGTTEAKAICLALDGRLIGIGRASYRTETGPDGRAEQDPADWWSALSAAVRDIDLSGVEVVALCGATQGPTLVAVDDQGMPVRPAVTWQDRRPGDTGFGLLPRMAWLAREDPVAAMRAVWLLPAWDALGLWLTGEAASSTQAHESPLSAEALELAGVAPTQVPAPRPVGSLLGTLRPMVGAALGLRPGTPVICGVNDGAASMLGAGLLSAGDAVDTGGASGGLAIYADHAVAVPGLYCAPAPLPGRWAVGGAMASLGASVDWLRATVLGDTWSIEELFSDASRVAPGSDGLIFLPYLAGERAPVFDETARGAFAGLTLAHGRGHLLRAVLEGAAYAMRHVAEPLAAAGAPVTSLRLAGRSTPEDLWGRIKADVLGVPVIVPAVGETAVLGAAILAAAGAGAVPDLATAVAAMTGTARRLEPDPATREAYDAGFARYRALYPALRSAGIGG